MEENNQDYIGMLWKKASENGYKQNEDYLRDKLMNDEEYRRLFHEKIQSQGYKPDYNEFSSRLGLEQQVQQPAPRVDVSDVEAQQQPESTILPENVGVDELRKRRQSIQTELDSDTEMNPMTISQRKLYEQQLKDIDRDIDKELHAKYDFSIENATAMKERNDALGAEVEKVLASANKDLQEMEAEHNGIGTRYTRQQYDRLVKLMMSDPDKAIRKLEDPDDPFSRLKLTKEEVDGLKSLAEERKKGREYMEEYAKTEEYRQQFLPMLEEEENKRKEQKSALVDEYSNYTVEKLKESIQSGDFSRYLTPVSMKDGKPKLTLDWLMPGTSLVKDLLWDRNQSEMLYAMHNIEQASKEADMERRRLEGKDIPVVTGLLHGVDWRGLNPLVDLRDATVQLGLSQKTKNGEELSGLEQEVMQTLDDKAKADMLYGNNYTVWDRLGTQLPEQLMFTLSFILSGGITGATEAGEKVAAKAALKAAARRAERGATGKFGTFVAEKVVPKTLGMATGATIQTFASPISWPSIAADFEKRYAGDVYYDKDGNLHVFDNGVSAPKALYQAAASAWIENFTEFAGENITKTAKLVDSKLLDVSGAVDDLMKKTGMKRIYDVVSNPIPGNLGKLAQKGSNLEEFSEEILGSIMNTLFATDQKAGQSYSESVKESVSNAFSQDHLLETFLSCTLTGMVLGGGGMARNAIATRDQRKAINRQVETSRAILSKVNGIDIDELDNQIENSEIKDLSKWMKQQSDANGWSADEQGAVISYVLGKTQQTMMRFNDESAIQQEMEELRKQAESMRNVDDGTIYNAMWDDGSGTEQPVNIVSGRVRYNTNEDGSMSFDPYTSSGMLIVRLPDGTMKQVSSRSIKSLESQTTVDELLEAQGNTVPQAMRRQFEEDGMAVPTVESVWGGAPMPGVTALNNGKLVYIGNDNGEYVFSNKDEATKKDMPEVRLSERQMVEIGLGAKIDDAIARGDMETKLEADNDMDFLRKMDEASEEVTEKKMWDYVTHLAASRVKTDEEGNVVFEDGNVGAYAAYLLARSNGAHDVAMAEIRKAIEARQAQLALVETVQGIDPDGNITSLQATTAEAMDHLLAIDFYQKALRNLEQKKASDENVQAAAVSEVEEDRNEETANTPVSQMEVGQQFPVQWHGQPAMATVMGKDADGRSVVTVRDMDGEDIEAGIDDRSDQQWESVRQKPQTDEQAPQQEPQPTPVQPAPTPQGPAPVAPTAAEAQPEPAPAPQPVSQNETPEPTPIPTTSDVAPSMEFPRDEEGNIDYEQITDPYVYAAAVTEEFGEDALNLVDSLIEGEETILAESPKIKDAIKRFREQRNAKTRLERFKKVRDILTTPQEQAETTTEETPVEQPMAETTQETTAEEAPIEETPSETPMESSEEGTEQEAPAVEDSEETPSEVVETPIQKPKPKEQTEYQKRLDAVGEPRTLEEAILLDIARGGAKFRWGNRDEDKKVKKRGIGDLWHYDQKEFKLRFQLMRKEGFTIETYAEAIMQGQLQYLGGSVSQQAERMDFQDVVAAIEDVLQFVKTPTEALEAIESKRNEEAEEEQRHIRSIQDRDAREQGFEDYDDMENYYNSLSENNLSDDDYNEINAKFAEQYQEENGRQGESETTGGEVEPDEQQGVRGESEGSDSVLQGEQPADEGTSEPARQGEGGERGDTTGGTPQGKEPEGAAEVRAEIDKLKAQRSGIVKQRDDIQRRYEQANGLFGDTQADEGDLFGGQNFLSPELAQTTIDGYNRQIKQIDEQIAKLEASLKRASSVKQTELGVEETPKAEPKKPQGAATENTIFTEDEYQRRKEALKRRHRTELNIAINPQDFEDLLYMAGYHIERGVRKFADFCKSMIEDLGDWVRPYLQTVYLGAKADDDIKKLGIDRKEWSSEDEVLDFDVENFDKQQESETGAHQYTDQQKRRFSDAVRVDMRIALERGEKPYRSINDIRNRAESLGLEVDSEGRDDIMLQELVEDGLVRAAREVVESGRFGGAKSKEAFDAICKLYEMQPTISMRSSNRVKMQQYSTPLPMAFVADMFAYKGGKVLEPTAGNGMLVFAIPSKNVTVNELDETRLANLREQGFPMVLNEDALTVRFVGKYDSVIANPPFGSSPEKDYDGKMIAGLDEQITLNALSAMKDDGRAAIIIGGNMEYGKNGGVAGNRAFWTYLYNHYNVKGVVDMDGKLYGRQGTTYPTRMILIDGRRSEEEMAQSTIYPPIKEKALRKAESFVDLYALINELISSKEKTNGTEILRTPGAPVVPDSNRPSGETSTQRPRVEPNANVANEQGGPVGTGSTGGTGQTATSGVQRPATTGGTVDVGQRPASVSGTQTSQSGIGTRTGNGERGRTDGNSGRVSDGSVSQPGNATDRVGLTQQKDQEKRTLTEEKLPYRKHSGARSLESVAPAAMVEAMDRVLSEIEKTYGKTIDEFVREELGYDTDEELYNALAAEQIDSVAMAIHQMKQGNAMVIGDQTGVGKGRQMAALIRWAHNQGKKPVFITQKADLFTDIYRDLMDVGSGDLKPFIFNSDGAIVDSDGNVVHKPMSPKDMAKVFEKGELPDGYDYAVLTYSQVNTGDAISQEEAKNAAKASGKRGAKKSKSDGKPTPKATFLRQIAEDNYLFLDESHTAAGESNTGYYLQSIVRTSKAVTFASATFAKRPDTMPLYAIRTAMSQANVKPNELIGIIQKGGVTLQEIMSRALTEAGQMVRRERDMSDVQTDWETISDPATVKRARENYDKTIEAFNAIIRFQELYIKPLISQLDSELAEMASTANVKKGTNKMGVENTPFASKTYNYTKQLMLALKVDAIVDKVIAEIKAGRHPVIALESTMEASIRDYSPGDIISEPTFSASLLRGLETVMQYTVTDAEGKDTHRKYLPSDLGPEGEKAYYELQDFIRESTSDIFISPLDAIIERLRQEGYKVGELTGRNQYVERNDEGKVVVKRRTDKDKKRMQREFNSGELDVLILNKSASTGISLHASERFSDQRQRTMVIAQPLSDINDYMQMIGRIDRTGQVHRGYYINLGLPVPAENRFLMMLATKLKSLNANTTTSQESESNSVEAPDLLNKYGSQVVVEYLRDNPEIYVKMGEPIKEVTVNQLDDYTPPENDEVVRKITGYVALLSTKEQEDFYNDVVRRYIDLIKYLDDTGQNDLKITVMPLRAKTIERRVSSQGVDPNGTNPFAKDAFVETVEIDVLRKPMKADEVRKTIESLNTPKGIENGHLPTAAAEKSLGERVMEIIGIVQREAQAKLEDEERRYEESKEKAAADIEKQREKISKQQKRTEAEKAEAIAKLIEEKNAWVEKQHENAVARIQEAERTLISRLNTFRSGQSVLMPDVLEQSQLASPELASPAIFCGFKAKDSKVTASTTFAVFATLDGRRRIEIKLSDGQALYNIRNMANENYDLANRVTLDNWDSEIPTSTRKNAYILTGNILQAVADTQDQNGNYPGQLISYTDENGDVHDGILMPDKWKPTMMKNSGVPINARLSQIEQGKAVASTDGKVTITKSRWSGSWLLTVPKSKKEGAVYFENPVILKVVGGFWQSRGQFAADINSVEDLRTVVNELANIGVKVTGEQNGGVELSVRTEPAPKKTKKVYKLMRLENGKLYPLFIDRNAMPIELGTWYNADSPNVADLENLEAGYAYKIDGNGNVVERKKINRTGKGSITGLPNVKSVNSAAEDGARWIAVTTDKSGKKTYHNVGINGSEGVSTYAMRPGWHAGSLPSMRQIGKGPQRNIRDSRFVWVEGEVAADVDYQSEAEQSPTKDIQTHIPTDGYYMKATNADKVKSQADRIGWYISGAFKPNRVISDAEAREVIDEYNAQHPDAPVEYDYEREGGEFTREDAERVNNTAAESKRIAFEAATTALARAGYEVVRATEEDIENLKKENKLLRKINGTINGWLGKDGRIYLTESGLNAETAVHEYTHLWAEALQLNDPKLWDEIKTLLKGTPTWNEVKNNPAYAKYDEDRLAEEVLAHLSGRDNGARMEAEAKRMIDESDTMADAAKAASMLNRLKEALKKFWTWVGKNLFGIKGKIDLDTVENMILADLVNGVNPFGPGGGRKKNTTEQSFTPSQPQNRIADEYNRMTGANVDDVNSVKRGWEKFARDQFDGLRPLEQMQQLIEKALGRKLRDSEKAYELATQLTSKTGQQIDREQLSYIVPVLQNVTEAIKSLKREGYTTDEAYKMVTNYLLAKHGLERNAWFEKQGRKEGDYAGLRGLAENLGENPDDFKAVAERIVSEFEQDHDTNELWKSLKALSDRMLEISYNTGMIDKDTYEELKKRHKYYVPLRGFADGTAADLFDYVTQSPHFQNIFKKATGRNSMADDPLANLMSMLHSAIVIGNQNEVMQKIYNMAVNSKSDLLRVTKPWYVYDDTTDTWEEKYPDIPEGATADEIDAIVKKFDADMQQKQQQGKAKRKLNRIDVGKKLLPYQAREHEMVAYIDGKRVVMHVAGNPLVAQAMNRSNTQQLNKVMQAIQTATRWYSSINTSWSPAFGPKNAMRDIRMMLFGAYVTGGIRKMWQSSKDIVKAGWALPRLLITGKMDGGLVKALGPQKAAQLEQWWNEFIENGGETGFTRTLNAEKAKGEVRDMIGHMLNGSKDGENRVRKYTIGLLEWIGRYSEDISRFAAYCQQRAQGESVLSSIQEAKNVTVNFNVKGGSDLAANMRAMYSFFNASMQGINRMRRLATEHPKRFSAGIAAMMLGGAVLPWLNMALFAMLGGDDDDWRKYEELTEYTANHNMILYVGDLNPFKKTKDKFLSIPWSQELAPFNALGNIWFRQQMGWNKGKSVAEQWGDMFVDLSPVSVASGNKPGVGLVKTIMPSFTTPVWEALFNEDFTGSPLYKDNQWNKYDKGWEKAYEGKTSKSVIDASRWLDENTGIDINPAIAEHLFSGVLGGMGRSGDKLLRYFTNGFQLQDAPFIRTIMFDSKKQGYIGAVQREYNRNTYEVLPEMKAKAEKADAMEFARLVNTEEYKIADVVSKYKTGKDLEGNKTGEVGIDKMEKEYKKIAGMSDGSEEYREQLEELRNNITERKMEMLDEIQQVKYENSGDLRRYIMDAVKEAESDSKAKYERKHPKGQ